MATSESPFGPDDLLFMRTADVFAMGYDCDDPMLVTMFCHKCKKSFKAMAQVALRRVWDEEKNRQVKARCPSPKCTRKR